MTGKEYQNLAMRTTIGDATSRLIELIQKSRYDIGTAINASSGIAGEAGEVNEIIKKWIFHGNDLDEEHLKKELGDVTWYIAMMCHAFGWDLDEIMQMNIDKLKARYPEGFDTVRANNREKSDI